MKLRFGLRAKLLAVALALVLFAVRLVPATRSAGWRYSHLLEVAI